MSVKYTRIKFTSSETDLIRSFYSNNKQQFIFIKGGVLYYFSHRSRVEKRVYVTLTLTSPQADGSGHFFDNCTGFRYFSDLKKKRS